MSDKTAAPSAKTTNPGKDYAEFSMRLTWTYPVAQAKGKKSQTCRDDITALQLENRGVKVKGLHPIEILYMHFLENKLSCYAVEIYNNRKPAGAQVVFKQVIERGIVRQYEDKRDDYYDIKTGIPHPKTAFQKEIENRLSI